MAENAAAAESFSGRMEISFAQSGTDALSARLSIENQSGAFFRKTEATLVHLEISDSSSDPDSSKEPCYELPFSVKAVKGIVVHPTELGSAYQKLALGGQIRKSGDEIEIAFPNKDTVVVDTKTGNVDVDTQEKYQKEVHFEDTPWQRTIITSNNDTRITIGPDNISSIERDGMMELFPKSYSMHVGAEPRLPASEELNRKLQDKGRDDLTDELERIDGREDRAQEAFLKSHGAKSSVKTLSETIRDRGLFLEKVAEALPGDARNLDASAENQLRIALRNMREQFGAGSPETTSFAQALEDLLKSKGNKDQQEEIDRLVFEVKRGGLLKNVVDNIEASPGANYQTMARDNALAIRRALISIHIAGGDSALKSFVSDVNSRLDGEVLLAPIGQDGPFHHGAIILTDEGATTYNGSFNLIQKSKD